MWSALALNKDTSFGCDVDDLPEAEAKAGPLFGQGQLYYTLRFLKVCFEFYVEVGLELGANMQTETS